MEPLKNSTDDPLIWLLNRLYARKRRELQEREKLKVTLVFDESEFKMYLHNTFSGFYTMLNNISFLLVVIIEPSMLFRMPSSKKSKTMNVQLMISCHSLMEKLEVYLSNCSLIP